jgi:hypothetical protein
MLCCVCDAAWVHRLRSPSPGSPPRWSDLRKAKVQGTGVAGSRTAAKAVRELLVTLDRLSGRESVQETKQLVESLSTQAEAAGAWLTISPSRAGGRGAGRQQEPGRHGQGVPRQASRTHVGRRPSSGCRGSHVQIDVRPVGCQKDGAPSHGHVALPMPARKPALVLPFVLRRVGTCRIGTDSDATVRAVQSGCPPAPAAG